MALYLCHSEAYVYQLEGGHICQHMFKKHIILIRQEIHWMRRGRMALTHDWRMEMMVMPLVASLHYRS